MGCTGAGIIGDAVPAMYNAVAEGAREMGVPAIVMAGPPARRV